MMALGAAHSQEPVRKQRLGRCRAACGALTAPERAAVGHSAVPAPRPLLAVPGLLHCTPSHAALAASLSCTRARSPSCVPALTLSHHIQAGPPSRSRFPAAPGPASRLSPRGTDPAAAAAAWRDLLPLSLDAHGLGAWGAGQCVLPESCSPPSRPAGYSFGQDFKWDEICKRLFPGSVWPAKIMLP